EMGKQEQWTKVGEGGAPVTPRGVLATFDSTDVPDQRYTIRLTVFDQAGNPTQDTVKVIVQNLLPTPTPVITLEPTATKTPKKSPPPSPATDTPKPTKPPNPTAP